MNFGKIKFIQDDKKDLYVHDKLYTIYQICRYKNNVTGLFGVRKVFFNSDNSIVKVYEKEYSAKQIKQFIKNNISNKYKLFPVNTLSYVDLPNSSTMLEVRSDLINNTCQSYDYDDKLC